MEGKMFSLEVSIGFFFYPVDFFLSVFPSDTISLGRRQRMPKPSSCGVRIVAVTSLHAPSDIHIITIYVS